MKAIYPTLYSFLVSFIIVSIANLIAYEILLDQKLHDKKIQLEKNIRFYIHFITKDQSSLQTISKNNHKEYDNYPLEENEFIYIQKKIQEDHIVYIAKNLPKNIHDFQKYTQNHFSPTEYILEKESYYYKVIYYDNFTIIAGFYINSLKSKLFHQIVFINIFIFIFIGISMIFTFYISKSQLEIPYKNLFLFEEKIKQILLKMIYRQKIRSNEIALSKTKLPPRIGILLNRYLNVLIHFSNSANNFIKFANEIFSYHTKKSVYTKLHSSIHELVEVQHISILELNFSSNRFEKIYEHSNLSLSIQHINCNPADCLAYRTNQIQVYSEYDQELSCCFGKQLVQKEILQNKTLFVIPLPGIGKLSGIALIILKNESIFKLFRNSHYLSKEQILELFQNQLQIYFNIAGMISHNIGILESYKNQAITDALTKLYNRRYILETLTTLLHLSDRNQSSLALLIIDIDNFKSFNDEYGHETGDEVLRIVAKVFKNSVRKSDVIGRFGGEEFIVILPNTNRKQALVVAEKIRKNVENINYSHFGLNNIPKVTISLGISLFPIHGYSHYHLLRKADEALYQAKRSGKNTTRIAEILPEQPINFSYKTIQSKNDSPSNENE